MVTTTEMLHLSLEQDAVVTSVTRASHYAQSNQNFHQKHSHTCGCKASVSSDSQGDCSET
jgi:hypothetical protein